MNKFMLSLFTVSILLITAFIVSCGLHTPDTQVCSGVEYDPDEYACVRGELVALDDDGNSSPSGNRSSSSSRPAGSSSSVIVNGGNPDVVYGSFTDVRDEQVYPTVEIGTQTWMAKNLNYKNEHIGPTRGSKCYDGKENNCDKYGILYEWYEAIEVCPTGWHLPTKAEWDALVSHVGRDAGKKLKATSEDWRDGDGTDDHGFGALPGGFFNNEFSDVNITGWWWTATERDATYSDGVKMDGGAGINTGYGSRKAANLYSVRCVLGSSSSSSITYGELVDERDEQKYRTVKIGTQNWMAENLNYETANSQCYNYKENNCEIYGRLYNWETAKTSCPEGWKLPTRSEWNALISYAGGAGGRKLKAKNGVWGDDYGTDDYGFGGLPGGQLANEFKEIYTAGNWLTATESNASNAQLIQVEIGDDIKTHNVNKTYLFSVRCIEDL